MISPEQVPDEVVKAALITDERLGMRTVIAAGLAAWPGAYKSDPALFGHKLILPLTEAPQGRIPTEADNDKA